MRGGRWAAKIKPGSRSAELMQKLPPGFACPGTGTAAHSKSCGRAASCLRAALAGAAAQLIPPRSSGGSGRRWAKRCLGLCVGELWGRPGGKEAVFQELKQKLSWLRRAKSSLIRISRRKCWGGRKQMND